MERTKGRVAIGKNPKDNLEAAKMLIRRHSEMGAASPLKLLEGVDWEALSPKVDAAMGAHEQAEALKARMEQEYAERDKAMPEILKAVQQSVSLLKASYASNPKKLGEWGLTVDDTPQPKKKKNDKN